ncbi:MAG: hypothetical protein AAAB35_18245 [Phyllobacterium sp.]
MLKGSVTGAVLLMTGAVAFAHISLEDPEAEGCPAHTSWGATEGQP